MTTSEIRAYLNKLREKRGKLAAFAVTSGVKSNTLLKIATNKISEPGHTIAQRIIEAAEGFIVEQNSDGDANA